MSSNLLQIGKSGTVAARTALELTAQNIANAGNADYARRSVGLAEVASGGTVGLFSSRSLGGVRVDQILRSDSIFLQNEARRTGSDAARSASELESLTRAESVVEQAGIYPALVEFEAAVGLLRGDSLNGALRASLLENGRTLADTLHIADSGLAAEREGVRFAAGAQGDTVNLAAAELARVNATLVRKQSGTGSQASLLDQRDALLRDLSKLVGITVEYGSNGVANVRLGDQNGPFLISGPTAAEFSVVDNSDGTISFSLDGTGVTISGGGLAGQATALENLRNLNGELDGLANQIIQTLNDAQSLGQTPAGTTGPAFFSGTSASDISVSIASGSDVAAAIAGSGPGSHNATNLENLLNALANGGPAAEADSILFDLSSNVNGRRIAHDALSTIAESATIALQRESAVDLDSEAANLVRFQQAFQASGRIIQVANDIFDSVLGIR